MNLQQNSPRLTVPLELIVITSRGLKIWPNSTIDAPYLRHCCCRFQSAKDVKDLKAIRHEDIIQLFSKLTGWDWM